MPRHASAAAKLIAKHLPGSGYGYGDRERGLATIQRALASRRRRVAGAWALAAVAAAAVAVIGARALHWPEGEPHTSVRISIDASPAGRGAALSSGAQAAPMPRRADLEPGQRIETPAEGGASLRLSTGTAMDLAGRTSFRVESQGATERFTLQLGEVAARVAKLAPGQRFIIATPDAEIEVRGTRFRLRLLEAGEACGGGSRTRLEVSEGLVEVRSAGTSYKVPAGALWPADCSIDEKPNGSSQTFTPNAASPAQHVANRALVASARPGVAGNERSPAPIPATVTPSAASLLSQQNDLFARGVALRRQGDTNGALRAYSALIVRFPSSPLVENAQVERMRLLASKHDASARAEAERYLTRYPNGFAAQEARQIATQP